ncbi:MAG: DJ-1 family glyoxalase III [Clostridium sp.]
MKKVAVLLAEGFETIEALTVVDILRRAEVCCDTFSLGALDVCSSHNIVVRADKMLEDNNLDEYCCIVIPGGMPGAKNLKEDSRVIELLKDFNSKNKLICALCAGPIALAEAGIIEGTDITCYPGFEKQLGNCNYKDELVVSFENIITGKGPAATIDFSFEILKCIKPSKFEEVKSRMLF